MVFGEKWLSFSRSRQSAGVMETLIMLLQAWALRGELHSRYGQHFQPS
jgi:hypothetical protein